MPWYVVQTHHKQELLALEQLRRQRFKPYAPKMQTRKGERWLFSGYVFVNFDIRRERWRVINSTRGCRRVMCMDPEKPSRVPTEMILEMMRQEKEGGYVTDIRRALTVGDTLKILDGPMAGHIGICQSTGKNKVGILLNLLGGKNMVYLNINNVELAAL